VDQLYKKIVCLTAVVFVMGFGLGHVSHYYFGKSPETLKKISQLNDGLLVVGKLDEHVASLRPLVKEKRVIFLVWEREIKSINESVMENIVYLSKPFSPATFMQSLEEKLDRRSDISAGHFG